MNALAATRTSRLPLRDSPLFVLTALLEQLRDVVELLPPSVYRAEPAARVSGSVGAHVRHTLDHVASLLGAVAAGGLSYDHRLRGTNLETEPTTAVNEIERLFYRLDRLTLDALDTPLSLSILLHPDHDSVTVPSSLGRELAFVTQHTIHHCACIALLLEWQGYRVPYGFGVAPSTARARVKAG